MPCYLPLKVYQHICGKTFKLKTDFKSDYKNAELPCGRCLGCRLEKAKEWALRCYHEAQMHHLNEKHEDGLNNCFITLTYRDSDLPANQCLVHRDFQLFMKRLRRQTGHNIRYYMCGEYGDKTFRPHYHAIIFGWVPGDQKYRTTRKGIRVYKSKNLKKLWGLGRIEVGNVTFKSAGYVARYILKNKTQPRRLKIATVSTTNTARSSSARSSTPKCP